mmetsp:Transcript_25554/g.51956  ORF Transcript_25554/g.51956 Transcript_25554/m.51956 type:complete len:208 (+) Transcript_25554:972-1595(+)
MLRSTSRPSSRSATSPWPPATGSQSCARSGQGPRNGPTATPSWQRPATTSTRTPSTTKRTRARAHTRSSTRGKSSGCSPHGSPSTSCRTSSAPPPHRGRPSSSARRCACSATLPRPPSREARAGCSGCSSASSCLLASSSSTPSNTSPCAEANTSRPPTSASATRSAVAGQHRPSSGSRARGPRASAATLTLCSTGWWMPLRWESSR